MEMPEPTEAHEFLSTFAGEWEGEEILHPSEWMKERRTATGRFSSKMILRGFFLAHEYSESRDGQVMFEGHGVYGWDGKRERYTMHWFDSMGYPPGETLGTRDGDTLTFESGEGDRRSRYMYSRDGDDQLRFSIASSTDGGQTWSFMMEGTYTRVQA